ncbi:snRNA-activating protein complex subunit 3 isoform X1 [Phyllobates terribilis]|uniref:snRNA-activating protein complex subunit 3 isoform X1 n=1 Tax=Phyllobates terribilis TaxID=111132 RepID=UPI003CCB6327
MDENIPVYEVTHVNTKKIHVASLGHIWRQNLTSCDLSLAEVSCVDVEDDELAAELGCTADTAAEIKSLCSVDSLRSNDEEEADPEQVPEDSCLVTLSVRKKINERRKQLIVDRAFRQETFQYEMESRGLGARPEDPSDLVHEGELVITMNLVYPVIFQKHKMYKPYETFMVLGSQRLTELRDAINCVSDLQIGGEFSNNPDLAPDNICKELFKSAFFYFEGIFYNDMRYPECRDISRTTIEWSESRDRGYGKFQSAKMEDFTFNDLNIKIGFPYMYCHQGDCEHIVTFTDIRLIHHEDCLDRRLYPLNVRKHWFWTRKCNVCKVYVAKWVTNQDSLAPDDPCFFCDVCFKMLHYDMEGNKLGDFVAYAYVDTGTFN